MKADPMGVPGKYHSHATAHQTIEQLAANLLTVENLTVHYRLDGREFAAISNVGFNIAPGEIVGVLGESGCGKTTTALSVLQVLPDNARVVCGSISFCGRDVLSLDEAELRAIRGAEIAIIYQDSSALNPVIRVGNQVSEVLRSHRRCSMRQAREEVRAVLTEIGLHESERIYNAYPHQLSGGQRQRIAIAQALICKPRLVIADEPTASVDPDTAGEILDCMKQLKKSAETAVLFISHDPPTLAAVADRIIVMYAGQIVEEGRVDEVYSQPLHPYTKALLQCAPGPVTAAEAGCKSRLPFIPGNAPDPFEILPGCSFSSRCGDRMDICDSSPPHLIEAYASRLARCFKYEVG
jgi:oligopeptide/dipeptide ABC transporter ATP-binding protein